VQSTPAEQNANDTPPAGDDSRSPGRSRFGTTGFNLPWNTPARISLMVAWACALLASAALAQCLEQRFRSAIGAAHSPRRNA